VRSWYPGPDVWIALGAAALLVLAAFSVRAYLSSRPMVWTVTLGKQFEGQVSQITSEPPRPLLGQRYVAIIGFRNDQGLVKPDMTANVSIKLGEARDAPVVPSAAVRRDASGRPVVEVLRGGRWKKVVVQVGLSDGRYTAIRSGLKPGEKVKVTPALL
jgi:multidrug efflux pump subunit AcrA (membrane-fusion protein)